MAEAESAETDRAPADRVRDLLGIGYTDQKRARAIELAVPEAADEILDWLREFAAAGAWRDFAAFANLALHLRPEGLAGVLAPVVGAATHGAGLEDLVELLAEAGEAGACTAEAVPALTALVTSRAPHDGPYYGLCLKAVAALGAIGGPAARDALRALASGDLPQPVRRQAAARLGIEGPAAAAR
jgi:HEAT repeat protein